MPWARVDYKELVSKKSCFLYCSEEKTSAHFSTSTLRLVCCVFVNSLINKRVKEQECYASSTILFLFYSFISFSRRAKTNFIGTISRLCIRLFLPTYWLNTEITSWYHGLLYTSNVRYYIFYREYLRSDEWMSYLSKRAMSRLKNRVCKKSKSG